MSKNIEELEENDMDNFEEMNEISEENETAVVVKPKWSLKKKMMIGGGIFAGLILGAVALGFKKAKPEVESEVESEEDNDENNNDESDSAEIPEQEQIEESKETEI